MGGCDNLVVVRSGLTAAAGQTWPALSPAMPTGHVRWDIRVCGSVATTHNDHLSATISHICLISALASPSTAAGLRPVAALVGLGRAGVHFDRLGQRRAMVRILIGLVVD